MAWYDISPHSIKAESVFSVSDGIATSINSIYVSKSPSKFMKIEITCAFWSQ